MNCKTCDKAWYCYRKHKEEKLVGCNAGPLLWCPLCMNEDIDFDIRYLDGGFKATIKCKKCGITMTNEEIMSKEDAIWDVTRRWENRPDNFEYQVI